jgi:hypothetical protein
MGIFLGRAVRALMGAIVWGAVAVGMYVLLRAMGASAGPFDAVREFGSVIMAIFHAVGAVIGGKGFAGLLLLLPVTAGQEGGMLFVIGAVRLVEIVALFMVIAAAVRVIVVISQGLSYGRP